MPMIPRYNIIYRMPDTIAVCGCCAKTESSSWLSWYRGVLDVADRLPVVVRFPAGPRVRLKTVDPPKGNGLGQKKRLLCQNCKHSFCSGPWNSSCDSVTAASTNGFWQF